MCAVGDPGAVVERERRGGVGLGGGVAVAGHDDGKAAGGEQGAQLERERQRDVLFEEGIADARAAVGASVRRVEKDGGAVERTRRKRGRRLRVVWRWRGLRGRGRGLRQAGECRECQEADNRFLSEVQGCGSFRQSMLRWV